MPTTLLTRAVLFDMDGTLVDSTAAVERVWGIFAARYDLDLPELLRAVHGVRMIDSVRRYSPEGTDAEAVSAELASVELHDMNGIVPIEGADVFVASLPQDRIAVVTSAPRDLAAVRLLACGIGEPEVFVSADDVERGKPDPEPFLTAARLLGVHGSDCVVFEDAEAGIRAGLAAGAAVVVVGAHRSGTTEGLARIADYTEVTATLVDGGILIQLP